MEQINIDDLKNSTKTLKTLLQGKQNQWKYENFITLNVIKLPYSNHIQIFNLITWFKIYKTKTHKNVIHAKQYLSTNTKSNKLY